MRATSFKRVRYPSRLKLAWNTVYRNGQRSLSAQTRKEVDAFAARYEPAIRKIGQALKSGSFEFHPALGILQTRRGKSPRPIVKSPISTRIVQRSLLNVLQENPRIQEYFRTPTSFGGIKERSVAQAIKAAYVAMNSGCRVFLHSDIKDFFTKIPRSRVLGVIASEINDSRFNDLLNRATKTELENLHSLGESVAQFPLHEIGVAQGCCLSPLMGNILLRDFDRQLNGRGIVCLRYIDDFLILGPTEKKVWAAFRSAQKLLKEFDFHAYDPHSDSAKADFGFVEKGINFLGCHLEVDSVAPNKESRQRLRRAIKKLIVESKTAMRQSFSHGKGKLGLAPTLGRISNILMGWGNQYSFCNNTRVMNSLELQMAESLEEYLSFYLQRRRFLGSKTLNRRERLLCYQRLLGVHLFRDGKNAPILPLKEPS